MLQVYGLKTCETCQRALKVLRAKREEFEFHDLRQEGVSGKQIAKWAKAVGWEKLLNRQSTTWRNLTDAEKEGVDEKKAIALMAENPALIKRPVIKMSPTRIYVGWSAETQRGLNER